MRIKGLIVFIIAIALTVSFVIKTSAKDAGDKLAGGVKDTATGWAEVPKEMVKTSEETNVIEGVTVGTVKGAGEAVTKTTKGAVKAATFYIPDEDETLKEKPAKAGTEKLGQGIKDTATGWAEAPKGIAETTEKDNIVAGTTIGTMKGAGDAIYKTTEGVVKAATFFIPEEKEEDEED